jgi:hypothetical protein
VLIAKIEKALAGLEKRIVEGQFKDCDKMLLRLGRIQASHPQVVDLHELAVKDSKEGPRLIWRQKPEQQQWLEARERSGRDASPSSMASSRGFFPNFKCSGRPELLEPTQILKCSENSALA